MNSIILNVKYTQSDLNFIIEIELRQKSIKSFRYMIYDCTSQVALLNGIKIGLTKLLKNYSKSSVIVQTNQYCFNIFTNENCNITANRDLINNIQLLINQFDKIQFEWIDYNENKRMPPTPGFKIDLDNYEIKRIK